MVLGMSTNFGGLITVTMQLNLHSDHELEPFILRKGLM